MGQRIRSIKYFLPIIVIYGLLIGGGFYKIFLESLGYIPGLNMTIPTFKHYLMAFTANGFVRDLFFTLAIALISGTISAILGTIIAFELTRSSSQWLKQLVTKVVELGLVLPYLYMVFMVILLFGKTGIYSRFLHHLQVIDGFQQFPTLVFEPYGIGIMLVFILKGTPFVTLFLLNIMSNINVTYESVAASLGARPYQILRRIYLPLCSDTLVWSIMILIAYNIGAFEVPYLLGSLKPQSLSVRLFAAYTSPSIDTYPLTMAIAVILFVLGFLVVALYGPLLKWLITQKIATPKRSTLARRPRSRKIILMMVGLSMVLFAIIPSLYVGLLSFFKFFKYPLLLPTKISLSYWQNLLLNNGLFLPSLFSTVLISLTTAFLATLIGFLAGRGIVKHHIKHTRIYLLIISIPLFIPGMSLFMGAHQVLIHTVFANHWTGIVLGHLLLCIPYSTNIAVAYFKGIPTDLEDVAQTLGASKAKSFRKLILPLIIPGLTLSTSIAFLISNTEYFSTFLIGGGNTITLSMIMYPYIANNDHGMSSVTGIVFVALHIVLFLLIDHLVLRKIHFKALYGME